MSDLREEVFKRNKILNWFAPVSLYRAKIATASLLGLLFMMFVPTYFIYLYVDGFQWYITENKYHHEIALLGLVAGIFFTAVMYLLPDKFSWWYFSIYFPLSFTLGLFEYSMATEGPASAIDFMYLLCPVVATAIFAKLPLIIFHALLNELFLIIAMLQPPKLKLTYVIVETSTYFLTCVGITLLVYMTSRQISGLSKLLYDFASTDDLSSLLRRNILDEKIESEDTTLQSHIALIDIDEFKAINDLYGHGTGDAVIQHLSYLILALPAGCVGYRLGGDEFAVLMDIPAEDVSILLKQFLDDVRSQKVRANDEEVSFTVSIGACLFEVSPQSAKNRLREADLAATTAKHHGRDRLVMAQKLSNV